MSLEQRETKRKKLVEKDLGLRRVQDALEHILVTGAKVRRDRWRRQRFRHAEQHRGEKGLDHPPREVTDPKGASSGEKRRRNPSPSPATKVCHAEDLRVYGKRYNQHLFPIGGVPPINSNHRRNPRRRRPSRDTNEADSHRSSSSSRSNGNNRNHKINLHNFDDDDSEWNLEHGDSIPPLLFRMARLSQEYPTEEQLTAFRTPRAVRSLSSYPNTYIGLEPTEVPRALIERCWERAVHAASNAMLAPVAAMGIPPPSETAAADATATTTSADGGDQATTTAATRGDSGGGGMPDAFSGPVDPIDPRPIGLEASRNRCQSLGIDIESLRSRASATSATTTLAAAAAAAAAVKEEESSSTVSCPRCTRSFATTRALEEHFYGTMETFGCCQPLLRPRRLDLIRTLLQNYAQSQTDLLWEVVLSQAAADPTLNDAAVDSDSDNTFGSYTEIRRNRQLGWRDIRRYMETAWRDSIPNEVRSTVESGSSEKNNRGSNKNKNNSSASDSESSSDDTFGSYSDNSKGVDDTVTADQTIQYNSVASKGRERHPIQQSFYVSTGSTFGNDHGNNSNSESALPMGSFHEHNPPLMLNPMILEAVNRRLIDRYADVPH